VKTVKTSGIGVVAPPILNFRSSWRSASCPGCFTDSVGSWLDPQHLWTLLGQKEI
jgi:hypothetical protein